MKNILSIGCLLLFVLAHGGEYKDSKTISKKISVDEEINWVEIRNYSGNVTVKEGKSNKVEFEVVITVIAESQSQLEKGMNELNVVDFIKRDRIKVGMKAPFLRDWWVDGDWTEMNQTRWPRYDYTYDFTVLMPKGLSVEASTVNQGDVLIEGITGDVEVNNINGDVDVLGATNVIDAGSINGHIYITFEKNPTRDSQFKTINGDIKLTLDKGLDTRVFFESMNGEMYSSFDFEYLDPAVEIVKSSNSERVKYKINEKTGIQIGSGGPELIIKTLNGNMYLKDKN